MSIKENAQKILAQIPPNVLVVIAGKGRSAEEMQQAIGAGIKIIGQNYLQEAEKLFPKINAAVEWHFIGHLQKNKVRRALKIFSCIQTVDSVELVKKINEIATVMGKTIPVFIEINIAREKTKFGIQPEKAIDLAKQISSLSNVKLQGLMTMEPYSKNTEDARQYFRKTKKLFEEIKAAKIPNIEMRFLSMGMSNSFKVAIEEGSNMVRIGKAIFEN